MGYHIIVKNTEAGVESRYVETLEELAAYSDLTKDAVVYQGEADWKPVRLEHHAQCKDYVNDWFRAGIKAQKLFRKLAHEHGLILENLSQDQASFKSYTENVDKMIKRGDCLVRNARNLEVEIKCYTQYRRNGDDDRVYWFEKADIDKHWNMQGFTGCPIVLAVFEKEGDAPIDDSLRVILVDDVRKLIEQKAATVVSKDGKEKYQVPVERMRPGFEVIDEIRAAVAGAA